MEIFQLIDMQDDGIHSEDFCSKLQKNMADKKSKRTNEVDALRTAFWFATIKERLQVPTSYQVEKCLDPNAFNKHSKWWSHGSKWKKYEVGQHVPRSSLVTQVDKALPGTKAILNHVLWQVLQTKQSVSECADDWLHKLSPHIQQCVFKNQDYGYSRIPTSKRLLLSLEKRVGIDALACLTILLCEMSEDGENPLAIEVGKFIYRMLLVLAISDCFGDFGEIFFDVYKQKVFPLAKFNDQRLVFDDIDFMEVVTALTTIVFDMPEVKQTNYQKSELVSLIYKILNGRRGIRIKFLLDPKTIDVNSTWRNNCSSSDST